MDNDKKNIEFIRTTTSKLPGVITMEDSRYSESIIHTHDEYGDGDDKVVDDNLYIGGERITDNFNIGETDPSGVTRRVGGLDPSTFGELKTRSLSEILIGILSPDPPVSSIELDMLECTIQVGENITITPTIFPENANDKTVTWTSSDSTVATVEDGVVTAIGVGTVTITADASGKTDTCEVEVEPVPVSSVSLNKNTVTLHRHGTITLMATVSPSNATYKTVTWTSSDTSLVTVNSNGQVTVVATQPGSTTITATADGKSATCTVSVVATNPTHTEPSATIIYSGPTTIEAGETLPGKGDLSVNVQQGDWSDGAIYAGIPSDTVLTMSPDSWGEPGVGGTTYTISGSVSLTAGGIPEDDFGNPCPSLQYLGGTVNSNTITIKVQEFFYVNGYPSDGEDDGDDITVMRKYVFDNLDDVTIYVTVPEEGEEDIEKFMIQVPYEMTEISVSQFNPTKDIYDIDVPMVFVSGDESLYIRDDNSYTNTYITKYKINLKK